MQNRRLKSGELDTISEEKWEARWEQAGREALGGEVVFRLPGAYLPGDAVSSRLWGVWEVTLRSQGGRTERRAARILVEPCGRLGSLRVGRLDFYEPATFLGVPGRVIQEVSYGSGSSRRQNSELTPLKPPIPRAVWRWRDWHLL